MPELVIKGEVIKTFVEGLSAQGSKNTSIRLETVGNTLVGNFVSNSHACLSDTVLVLDGIEKDGMEGMLVGVDLADLQLIPKLVGKEDTVSIKFNDGKCVLAFGPSRRSFKLLSGTEIPDAFTAKPTLTAKWKVPKESIKALVDTLYLEGSPVITVLKAEGDTSVRLSTKDYGGLNAAEYLLTGAQLKEYDGPPAFRSMFDYEMFSSVKGLPTESDILFRCDQDYPIEMVGVKGPVTSRIMLAPRVEEV